MPDDTFEMNMGLFSSIGKAFKGLGKNISKGISGIFSGSGGILSGTDLFTGINPVEDYTGITAAKMQQDIAEQNLALQREQFDYQKMLNDQQMQREDTAYQRKVADMTKAGFNPILATGGSGSPSAPLKAASAPQLDSSFTDKYAGAGQALGNLVLSAISMKKDFMQKDAQIQLLQAERNKANAEAAGIRIENQYLDDYYSKRNEGMGISNDSNAFAFEVSKTKAPIEIRKLTNDIDLQEKRKVLEDLYTAAERIKITGYELDNIGKGLDNDIKHKNLDYLDKQIEDLAIAIARKQAEYDEYEYARRYFHERYGGSPVGYAFPHRDNLAYNIVRNAIEEVDKAFSGKGKIIQGFSPFDRSYSHFPSSLRLKDWQSYERGDYGVRRNY